MKLFKCNGCGELVEMPDNERLIIHVCGSGDIERICPDCGKATKHESCKHCKAIAIAQMVYSGNIGLVDAILSL